MDDGSNGLFAEAIELDDSDDQSVVPFVFPEDAVSQETLVASSSSALSHPETSPPGSAFDPQGSSGATDVGAAPEPPVFIYDAEQTAALETIKHAPGMKEWEAGTSSARAAGDAPPFAWMGATSVHSEPVSKGGSASVLKPTAPVPDPRLLESRRDDEPFGAVGSNTLRKPLETAQEGRADESEQRVDYPKQGDEHGEVDESEQKIPDDDMQDGKGTEDAEEVFSFSSPVPFRFKPDSESEEFVVGDNDESAEEAPEQVFSFASVEGQA